MNLEHIKQKFKSGNEIPVPGAYVTQEEFQFLLSKLRAPVAGLPERDTTKPAEAQGLFRKFDVRRTDGSDVPGGKHHGCRYFVLDVDHDRYAPATLGAYAALCEADHPGLARDLREKWGATVAGERAQLRAIVALADEIFPCLTIIDKREGAASGATEKIHDLANAIKRAALASAPVAGEATDADIWRIAQMPECHHGGDFSHSVDPIPFARALLSRYAAPQASDTEDKGKNDD